jgi:hypothetical protein
MGSRHRSTRVITRRFNRTYGQGGAFGTQGRIDPHNHLISILLIQRADSYTDSLRNIFLNMAEASVGK